MADSYLTSLLASNETVQLITHRHWFVLVEQILVEIFLSLITLILVTVFLVTGQQGQIALGYLVVIIPLVSLVRDVFIWRSHKYVVTNLRVIQVMGVFNKNVIDSSLEKVNDVKMEQSALGRIFNFGDLEILTASDIGANRFTRIGDPVRFKTAMLNAKITLEEHGSHPQPQSPTNDIPTLIARLGELRDKGVLSEEEFQAKKTKLLSQI